MRLRKYPVVTNISFVSIIKNVSIIRINTKPEAMMRKSKQHLCGILIERGEYSEQKEKPWYDNG